MSNGYNLYGYPKLEGYNEKTNMPGTIVPIRKISKIIPEVKKDAAIPYAINPNEVFVPLTPYYTNELQGRYIISNCGRIYDLAFQKFLVGRYNQKYDINKPNNGYLVCHISRYKDPYTTESIDIYVHRAVMFSFCYFPGCETLEVNHRNGIHSDNNLSNLEWVTRKENIKHSLENHLRTPYNFDRHSSEVEIREICQYIDQGYSVKNISSITGKDEHLIYGILNGSMHRDIASEYRFFRLNGCTKYPDEIIEEICRRLSEGDNAKKISEDIGIDKYIILDILNKKIYQEISNKYSFINADFSNISGFDKRLTTHQIIDICIMLEKGIGREEILKRFEALYKIKLQPHTITNIKSGKIYKEISSKYLIDNSNLFLSESTVRDICKDIESGLTNGAVASKYHIPESKIARIRRRETYADISKDYNFITADEATRKAKINEGSYLSDMQVVNICNLLKQGCTPTHIANSMGVKLSSVNNIKNQTGYTHISKNYDFPTLEKRLSADVVRNICTDLFVNKMRNIDAISKYHVSADTIKRIKNGSMHKDIVKDYINL